MWLEAPVSGFKDRILFLFVTVPGHSLLFLLLLMRYNLTSCTTVEPRCGKTGLRGFRPGPTQTRLYGHERWLEAWNFGSRK